jgi:hypothetical protein
LWHASAIYGKGLRSLELKKQKLNEIEFNSYAHERDVWWCSLGVNVGVEADGKHGNFERPVHLVVLAAWKQAITSRRHQTGNRRYLTRANGVQSGVSAIKA